MEFQTDSKILEILEKDYKQFKRILLDLDDKYLEDFKDKPKMFNVFMFGIVNDNKALSTIIKKMVKEGCNKKEVSKVKTRLKAIAKSEAEKAKKENESKSTES